MLITKLQAYKLIAPGLQACCSRLTNLIRMYSIGGVLYISHCHCAGVFKWSYVYLKNASLLRVFKTIANYVL